MNTDNYGLKFLPYRLLIITLLLFMPVLVFSDNSLLVLNCPQDQIIDLPPGECSIVVDYDTLQWSSTEALVDTFFSPPSGTDFGIGTTMVVLEVTTSSGVLEVCLFNVIVNNGGPIFPDGCGLPDLPVSQDNCEVVVTVPNPTVEGCGGDIELTVAGDLGSEIGQDVNLPLGTYVMQFTATDESGKMGTCIDTFSVVDEIPPALYCKPAIQINYYFGLVVEVLPEPFSINSFDNCITDIDYYFLEDSALVDVIYPECCELESGISVTVVAEDESGNQSTCESHVHFVGSFPCGGCDVWLTGNIETPSGEGINEVNVTLNSDIKITDTTGFFSHTGNTGQNWYIDPSKDTNPLNGVTTYDAVLITRHVLNVEPLTDPYQIIAADINRSRSLTTFDVVALRKLILYVNTDFPNNTSWRFIPADHVFPNPMNPFQEPFPEVVNLNFVTESNPNVNFIGIKVGDVNGSADPKE